MRVPQGRQRTSAVDRHSELAAEIGGLETCLQAKRILASELAADAAALAPRGEAGWRAALARAEHAVRHAGGWVAICALGDTSTYLLDHAPGCRRCWTGGGAGTPGATWADWHMES